MISSTLFFTCSGSASSQRRLPEPRRQQRALVGVGPRPQQSLPRLQEPAGEAVRSIVNCDGGNPDHDGNKITLKGARVLDLDADGVAVINQAESPIFFDMERRKIDSVFTFTGWPYNTE